MGSHSLVMRKKTMTNFVPENAVIDIAKVIFDNMMLAGRHESFGESYPANQESVDYWQTFFERRLHAVIGNVFPDAYAKMIDSGEFAFDKDSSGNWVANY